MACYNLQNAITYGDLRTVRPGAAETQNDFFHILLLFISLNEEEISE